MNWKRLTLIVRIRLILDLEHERPEVHIGNVDVRIGRFGRHGRDMLMR